MVMKVIVIKITIWAKFFLERMRTRACIITRLQVFHYHCKRAYKSCLFIFRQAFKCSVIDRKRIANSFAAYCFCFLCEKYSVDAAVCLVRNTDNIAFCLKCIYHRRNIRFGNAGALADFLLRKTVFIPKLRQDNPVSHRNPNTGGGEALL